ncbi:MAG: hypothetical protein AB7E24_16685 [Novosphingobium sp.]
MAFRKIEGQLDMLELHTDAMEKPSHFVLIEWRGEQIVSIRDSLFANYGMQAVDCVGLTRPLNVGSWQNLPFGMAIANGGFVEGFRAPAGVRKSYKYDPR